MQNRWEAIRCSITSAVQVPTRRKLRVKMNFNKLFLIVILAALLLLGQTEAGRLKKLGKKIEKAGKRVFNAAQKGLPVAAGVQALGR